MVLVAVVLHGETDPRVGAGMGLDDLRCGGGVPNAEPRKWATAGESREAVREEASKDGPRTMAKSVGVGRVGTTGPGGMMARVGLVAVNGYYSYLTVVIVFLVF